jgi:CRP-like cAMP-binding protein
MAATMSVQTSVQQSPQHNHLLSALPLDAYARIAPHLEAVTMPLGEAVYQPGALLHHAWFPTTAVISLHYVMENGASSEFADVGNEGMIGLPLVMGGHTSPSRATVCIGGHAYRLSGQVLAEEFSRGGAMMRRLLLYTQALFTQVAQTAVCNRHHSMEQQMCRWLLLTMDRQPSQELLMTQELIAGILGVRREGITETAGGLQRAGLISYRRGHITVVDRAGLESRACECYKVITGEFGRLLGTFGSRTHSPLYK